MRILPRAILFVSRCVELYARYHHLDGEVVLREFYSFRVCEFLIEAYPELHVKSDSEILAAISEHMKSCPAPDQYVTHKLPGLAQLVARQSNAPRAADETATASEPESSEEPSSEPEEELPFSKTPFPRVMTRPKKSLVYEASSAFDWQRLIAPVVSTVSVVLVVAVLIVVTAVALTSREEIPVTVAVLEEMEELPPEPEVEPPESPTADELLGEAEVSVEGEGEFDQDLTSLIPQMALSSSPSTHTFFRPPEPENVMQITLPLSFRAFNSRSFAGRRAALERFGGNEAAEAAVMRALRWLKTRQLADGSWQAKGEGDATAFALLAFLSHGEDLASPEFGLTVSRALKYLMAHHTNNMSVYALAEAAGLIRLPEVKEEAERAISEMLGRVKAQGQANAGSGIPRFCAVMALMSARLARLEIMGLDEICAAFADSYAAMRDAKGPDFVRIRGEGAWHYMIAGVALQYLGRGEEPATRKMMEHLDDIWLPATLGSTAIACCPVRSNFFATMIFFNGGGAIWQKWNAGMLAAYVATQEIDSSADYVDSAGEPQEVGFWHCQDQHIGDQPFWPTCYIAHQLMVYYRYLPTYAAEARGGEPTDDEKRAAAKKDPYRDDVQVEVTF